MAEYLSEVTIPGTMGEVVVTIRYLSQPERERIAEEATARGALQPDRVKQAHAVADRMIVGWQRLHPLDALGWGYVEDAPLLTGEDGYVPYAIETARRLYRLCQYDHFAMHLDAANRGMMEAIAREKKAALQRSGA